MLNAANLLILLNASLQCVTHAEPLPRLTEHGLPQHHVFHSDSYKDTDTICLDLYKSWIEAETKAKTGRHSFGEALPLVVSSNIRIFGMTLITFLCKDQRTHKSILTAVQKRNEVAVTGLWSLQCKPEVEVARRRPRPAGLKNDPVVRAPGECVPGGPQSSSSVLVKAGTSNCLDIGSQSHASIEAYLMDEDAGTSAENVFREEYAEWMSILEVGTSRHEQVKFQDFVSITTDSRQSKVYRACAKMRPGYGNGRLYLISTS